MTREKEIEVLGVHIANMASANYGSPQWYAAIDYAVRELLALRLESLKAEGRTPPKAA